MLKPKKRRQDSSINAGSMADIAFLLLIFFLVTTTILSDEGLMVKLPPYQEETEPEKITDRNVFNVKLNAANQLLVEGEYAQLDQLRNAAIQFVTNPLQLDHLAVKPTKAVISFQCDRGTNYDSYLYVYNELKAAYREMRDDLSMKQFGEIFADLNVAQRKDIQKQIPIVISEAEPFDAEGLAGL